MLTAMFFKGQLYVNVKEMVSFRSEIQFAFIVST